MLDRQACYEAFRARDERFDGRLFVGVTSTGIYCRPVCPARPAKIDNCRFFRSSAEARAAGFRPCLRCRPEATPGAASWRGTSNTLTRGFRLIDQGELDGDGATVDALAARLGVGARQVRRLFKRHLGATPLAVAQARRVLLAARLIEGTPLQMSEIALAAGFGSVRRFNEAFRALFECPPSALRHGRAAPASTAMTLSLPYRPPYDWQAMRAHLAARAIEGVEHIEGDTYRRTACEDGQIGLVEVTHQPSTHSFSATLRLPSLRLLSPVVARIRRVLDLGADVRAIGAHLARDSLLSSLVAARPGLRAPGGWDGFEAAARSILGQQVSVVAARDLGARLVQACGVSVGVADGAAEPLTLAFPTARQVLAADLSKLPTPRRRREALVALAGAAVTDPLLFEPGVTLEDTIGRLRRLPGIGDWTAHMIALRAMREPDAFPANDAALLRVVTQGDRRSVRASELGRRAEPWRPWRAYAAQHLWAADAHASSSVRGGSHG